MGGIIKHSQYPDFALHVNVYIHMCIGEPVGSLCRDMLDVPVVSKASKHSVLSF